MADTPLDLDAIEARFRADSKTPFVDFLRHMLADVPALLARVRELEAENRRLKAAAR